MKILLPCQNVQRKNTPNASGESWIFAFSLMFPVAVSAVLLASAMAEAQQLVTSSPKIHLQFEFVLYIFSILPLIFLMERYRQQPLALCDARVSHGRVAAPKIFESFMYKRRNCLDEDF